MSLISKFGVCMTSAGWRNAIGMKMTPSRTWKTRKGRIPQMLPAGSSIGPNKINFGSLGAKAPPWDHSFPFWITREKISGPLRLDRTEFCIFNSNG